MHVWSCTPEMCMCHFQCCESVQSLFFWNIMVTHSKQLWHQTTWLWSHSIHTGLCAALTLTFLCLLLHVHVWNGWLYPGSNLLHQTNNNFNSTETISSPIQVTQPSSTQESFAKSISPALFFSLYFFLSFSSCLLQLLARLAPMFSLPPQSKDGGRVSEASWMDGEFTLDKLGWREISLLKQHLWNLWTLRTMLQMQWCCHFYFVAHDVGFSVLL